MEGWSHCVKEFAEGGDCIKRPFSLGVHLDGKKVKPSPLASRGVRRGTKKNYWGIRRYLEGVSAWR